MTATEALEAVVEALSPHIGGTVARSARLAHCQRPGIAPGGLDIVFLRILEG